jgi:hypothetical protein
VRTPLLICILSLTTFALQAQSVSTLMGARAAGMGYASSCLDDEWSTLNNVAGIASIKEMSFAAAYEVKPQLEGANRTAFVANMPTTIGTAAFSVFRFGDALYNEQRLSASFANRFGLASLGTSINYIQYQASGFGTKGIITISFGGIAELTKQIFIGAHIQNINQPKLTEKGIERVPTVLTAGIGFTPSEKVVLITEVQKDLDYEATFKTGIEYKPVKKFAFRTGFALYPTNVHGGIGFIKTRLTIDYAFQYLQAGLGTAHQAAVSYKIKHK